jgi:hypothetical protein
MRHFIRHALATPSRSRDCGCCGGVGRVGLAGGALRIGSASFSMTGLFSIVHIHVARPAPESARNRRASAPGLRQPTRTKGYYQNAGLCIDLSRRAATRIGNRRGRKRPLICSLSGHSIEEGMDIVEHYLPKTADQADRAIKLLSVKW